MNMKSKAQKVLITGAAGGIGRCCAREFARATGPLVRRVRATGPLVRRVRATGPLVRRVRSTGREYELILTDVDRASLTEVADQLRAAGATVHSRVVDVADRDAVQALAQWVIDERGGLDILVNNAGIGYQGELADTSITTWERLIAIDLLGPLYHIDAFLPHMIERRHGHIVNVSSGQAFFQLPTWGAYTAVKLALGVVSETMRIELRKYGVKVTTIYPGLVNTGFYDAIEPATVAQRLALKLMPYYAMTPEAVGRALFEAIVREKPVEMVSALNYVGKALGAVTPLAYGVRRIANWILATQPSPHAVRDRTAAPKSHTDPGDHDEPEEQEGPRNQSALDEVRQTAH